MKQFWETANNVAFIVLLIGGLALAFYVVLDGALR